MRLMAPAGIGDKLEGIHAVAAAVERGRVTEITIERSLQSRPDIRRIRDRVADGGGRILEVDDVRPLAVTSAPQGVIARARPIPLRSLDDLCDMASPSAVVVLDHVEDGRNVGAIARSALAAGVPAMVVAGRRAAPLGPAAFKAAAGAFESLGVAVVGSIANTLERLRSHGLWLVGLDGAAPDSVWDCDLFDAPVAVVVGSEGSGLTRLVAERMDVTVSIPVRDIESLNVSVAASIALFELARRRQMS
jgi:23S rRNA (guanosine2251-2'-O)-methyltransferase